MRNYSGPYFPTFGLNTERNRVSLRIQSESGKIRTRITQNTNTFYAVYILQDISQNIVAHKTTVFTETLVGNAILQFLRLEPILVHFFVLVFLLREFSRLCASLLETKPSNKSPMF